MLKTFYLWGMRKFFKFSIVLIFFLVIKPALICSQIPDTISVTDKETFVSIFMKSRRSVAEEDTMITNLLSIHGISIARYRALISSAVFGESVTLSENEVLFKEAIQKQNKEKAERNQLLIQSLCQEKGISETQYLYLLNKYHSDTVFQNSLVPIFEKHIATSK